MTEIERDSEFWLLAARHLAVCTFLVAFVVLTDGIGLLLLGFFLPTLVAFARRSRKKLVVFMINLLLGTSVIGWLIALYVACQD